MSYGKFLHPIVGNGYYPLDDESLEIELNDADIIELNPMFGAFTLIVGYRSKGFTTHGKIGQPFVCIKNNSPGLPHLFIVEESK